MKKISTLILFALMSCVVSAQSYADYALQSSVDRVQPLTGIVFWTTNGTALSQLGNDVQLEFAYMVPTDVINQQGVYDWTAVEQELNAAASRGHQCILRFRYTYPGKTVPTVPEYIRNLPNYTDRSADVEGMYTFIPDWSMPELETFTLDFFEAFAAKYDNDPRLAYLQVGFGSYSEYHLYAGPFQLGVTFPSKTFQTSFFNNMDTQFQTTSWSVSIDAADGSHSPLEANPSLVDLSFGLFDDSFMHENHSTSDSEYNRASWLFFGENRWQTAVAGGEFSYYTAYDQEHVLDLPNGPHGRSFESFADQYHFTYIIGNDQFGYQTQARIKEASMYMGYHYEVTAYQTNGVDTKVTIVNNGIAPIYYDAYPALGGVRSTESLSGLLPGQTQIFTIPQPIGSEPLEIESDRLVTDQIIQYDANLSGMVTSNANGTKAANVEVFPNPVKHEIQILNGDEGEMVQVYDHTGTLVLSKKYQNNSLLVDDLTPGYYILRVEGKQFPFIKQ